MSSWPSFAGLLSPTLITKDTFTHPVSPKRIPRLLPCLAEHISMTTYLSLQGVKRRSLAWLWPRDYYSR